MTAIHASNASNAATASTAMKGTIAYIQKNVSELRPRAGIVLGSGLGALVEAIEIAGAAPYSEIPGFPVSTVSGHAGRLVIGTLDGVPVAVMQGRAHLYEGYPVDQVVYPARVLAKLGADPLILTNASGSLNLDFHPRELMLLTDHLNLTGTNPLLGPNDPTLGPRFPDLSVAYDLKLRTLALEVARERSIVLREGVYAGLLGPSYETPAEVRMLKVLGADAVGMSTVLETIAARHMGARVLGLSCLCNMAAGISKHILTHDEVKEAADAVASDLIALLRGVVARLAP